jgi:hypothetical protein
MGVVFKAEDTSLGRFPLLAAAKQSQQRYLAGQN